MSVLIEGMEMPKRCADCYIRENNCCPLLHKWCAETARLVDCPLVPVPPHGRLGDLDTLQKQIDIARNYGMIGKTAHYKLQKLIKEAPTIIPASEEETDG